MFWFTGLTYPFNTFNDEVYHLATGVLVLPFHSADILGEGFPKMTEGSMTCLVLSIFFSTINRQKIYLIYIFNLLTFTLLPASWKRPAIMTQVLSASVTSAPNSRSLSQTRPAAEYMNCRRVLIKRKKFGNYLNGKHLGCVQTGYGPLWDTPHQRCLKNILLKKNDR